MESVLISIRPDWIQAIFDGKKTVEIRKTRPKIDPPFRCYIYCTSVKAFNLENYVQIHAKTGGMVDEWSGKVIGEFICDKITEIPASGPIDVCCGSLKGSAMSREEFDSYIGWDKGFGWHISDLKIYHNPKPLSEFKRWKGGKQWKTLERLKRAPQSWCYVDGGLIG